VGIRFGQDKQVVFHPTEPYVTIPQAPKEIFGNEEIPKKATPQRNR
jgi:hypothetical protein